MFHFFSCSPNEETTWTKVHFTMYGINQSNGDIFTREDNKCFFTHEDTMFLHKSSPCTSLVLHNELLFE